MKRFSVRVVSWKTGADTALLNVVWTEALKHVLIAGYFILFKMSKITKGEIFLKSVLTLT